MAWTSTTAARSEPTSSKSRGIHHLVGGEKRVELLLLLRSLRLHLRVEVANLGRHDEALGGVEPEPVRGKRTENKAIKWSEGRGLLMPLTQKTKSKILLVEAIKERASKYAREENIHELKVK